MDDATMRILDDLLRCDVSEFDRVDLMRKARELLGSSLHPYLGAAADAAMED